MFQNTIFPPLKCLNVFVQINTHIAVNYDANQHINQHINFDSCFSLLTRNFQGRPILYYCIILVYSSSGIVNFTNGFSIG